MRDGIVMVDMTSRIINPDPGRADASAFSYLSQLETVSERNVYTITMPPGQRRKCQVGMSDHDAPQLSLVASAGGLHRPGLHGRIVHVQISFELVYAHHSRLLHLKGFPLISPLDVLRHQSPFPAVKLYTIM